ncbi:NAD-dependent epimerase/dehydratase family protein [Streptomyces sp. NBC_00503]|uniref:NAD-dependent epimerase/dehydratase family protein n=1 Tax=Streptomyces sp. NBC_00503 TaxID=2903659 RepID=UPI002E81C765|nr:NAD-dependent epimerase/dehydratase family protein [Streptomyces sp. NBC_00503]WUD86521.1 NAD-dependent epimerase/dehydratase family protein [Streptomyces sp. NBC_00503]
MQPSRTAVAPKAIVLTGATGFIGSAVLEILARRPGIRVRALVRTPGAPREGVEWVKADLADPASLRGLCEGAHTLVHLASYIGRDPERCHAVNVVGGAALVAEAVRAGTERLVHLSTAAVYGNHPHRGIEVDGIAPDPASVASRTRLEAEAPVLAAGGLVLRPGLVLGTGDRWVVATLAELLRRVPARWDGGRGLLSVIGVGELAGLIASLATAAGDPVPAGIHHASHPVPVTSGALLAALAAHGVLPEVHEDWPWERCLAELRAHPGSVSERQFALLARDHSQLSTSVWHLAGLDPDPDPLSFVPGAAPWYRTHLAQLHPTGGAPGHRA